MTAVDFCQAPAPTAAAKPLAPAEPGSEFPCTACGDIFASALEHRAHFKSERHVYNTKRKQAGLKAISQEAWERKLRESRAAGQEHKGTAHLKASKQSRKASENTEATEGSVDAPASEPSVVEPEAPPSPRGSLFDRKHFKSVELCLAYMEKSYSFFIPDQQYCLDVEALLLHLHEKVQEQKACIHCNRRFPDAQSVRRHMIDKGHTQLASEVLSRRGSVNAAATNEMAEEIEPFYDFIGSMREVSNNIKDPLQKVASIMRYFDVDKDEKLGPNEVAALWAAASEGGKLSESQYEGACAMCEANPKDGLDVEALAKLYESGLADLDEHFKMLQDLLVKRKPKELKAVQEGDEDAEDDEEDGDDEDGESEDEDGDEIIECEDEDEFAEVMRVLGLEPVSVTDTGDLRLPNGKTVCSRDVAYIYKQRGVRPDKDELALTGPPKVKRAQLMLSNAGSGCLKMAMSKRQEGRAGRMIIAVLKKKNWEESKLGIKANVINKKNPTKIRTGRGDMSNGR